VSDFSSVRARGAAAARAPREASKPLLGQLGHQLGGSRPSFLFSPFFSLLSFLFFLFFSVSFFFLIFLFFCFFLFPLDPALGRKRLGDSARPSARDLAHLRGVERTGRGRSRRIRVDELRQERSLAAASMRRRLGLRLGGV